MAELTKYETYKPSGINWIEEVPEHWEVKRLKNTCSLIYGESLAEEIRQDGVIEVFGSNGKVGEHNISNTSAPCIIVGRKGSFGKVNYSYKKVFAIDTTYFIDDRFTKNQLRWLYYTLDIIGLDKLSKDTGVPGLNREDAYNEKLPLPPKPEQLAIANYLDDQTQKIDRLIANKKAVELKPDQIYPKTKIEEINEALRDLQQKKELYDQFISSADFQYDAANFHAAKASYRSALELFPESTYPKERITTIDGILKAEIERVQKEYNAAIAEADRFFMQKAYDNAINQYTIAAGIKPDEEYPLKRIHDITKIIEANVVVDVTKVAEIVQSNNLVRYEFNPVPRQGRRESYIILKTKNLSNNDFKLFLNYGKDGSNNGGFVINIPNLEQTRDYIVKVGSQYKWFSEDNNWVSLQPEGGNIKVELIQISQE
jgi:restriction endonuclease S subunit